MKAIITKEQAMKFIIGCLVASGLGIAYIIGINACKTPEEYFVQGTVQWNREDYKGAEQSLLKAVDSKSREVVKQTHWRLGELYRTGRGNVPVNGEKAKKHLTKAAVLGSAQAQYELALMYDVGDKIPENRKKAVAWMSHAADSGMPEAMYAYAVWMERGYTGTPDMRKILALYEKAAEHGHKNAIKSLIVLYGEGAGGFPHNLKRRAYWMNYLDTKGK